MKLRNRVLVIGEACVDVALPEGDGTTQLRLGGVLHACRGLWALGIEYELAFIAPEYLVGQVEQFGRAHGAASVHHLGTVIGCPNVILIGHLQEAHSQHYEMLLRNDFSSQIKSEIVEKLKRANFEDILLFPGQFHLPPVLEICGSCDADLHVDWGNSVDTPEILRELERSCHTFIISTSSSYFLETCKKSPIQLARNVIPNLAQMLLFKENRGGARLFRADDASISVGAQVRPIRHSVGVGDCFDAAFVGLRRDVGVEAALAYASWVAAEYGSTFDINEFQREVARASKIDPARISNIRGVVLPWEDRSDINIYIAAPDFDYLDQTQIDLVARALEYHNFSPRLPVREHGQTTAETTSSGRKTICDQDLELLDTCDGLVAVYTMDDPGTLVEIGLAAASQKPVIVYDPGRKAKNLILTELPNAIVHTIDEVLVELFSIFSK